MTRDVVNPVFLNCCQHTVDKYWENIFREIAYGNTPYGSYVHNSTFCCKSKNGVVVSILIDENNTQKTHDDIYNAIKTNLNIQSPTERMQTIHEFDKTEEEMKTIRNNWSDIKKKNVKDLLVDIFTIKMSKNYNLSLQQSRYLRSIIHTGILFKAIEANDIIMENGNIKSIVGIYFSDKNIRFDLDLYNSEISDTVHNNDTTKQRMSKLWDKYITNLENKKIEI